MATVELSAPRTATLFTRRTGRLRGVSVLSRSGVRRGDLQPVLFQSSAEGVASNAEAAGKLHLTQSRLGEGETQQFALQLLLQPRPEIAAVALPGPLDHVAEAG